MEIDGANPVEVQDGSSAIMDQKAEAVEDATIDGFTESNQTSEPEVTDEAAPAPQGEAIEETEDSSLAIDGFTESNQTNEPEVTDEPAPAPQGEAIEETEDSSLAIDGFTESNQTSEPEVTDEAAIAPQDIDGFLELVAAWRRQQITAWREQQITAARSGSESKRETGTIKRFHDKKGYGYISPDSGGNDVYVQLFSIQSFGSINIPTGLKLEYDIKIDPKGKPEAVNVTVVEAEEEIADTNPISSSAIETHVQSEQEHQEVEGSYNANKRGLAWAENNKMGQKSALDSKAWPSLPDVPKTSTTSIKIIAPKVLVPKVTEAASTSQGAGSESKRQTGTIKWFNDEKRYGFILQDRGRSDVFFHKSSIKSDHTFLWEGMKVEYDVISGQEGKPKAVNVKVKL